MPDRKFLLTTLVVASILALGWVIARAIPVPSARLFALATAGLFALAVVRTTLIRPILVLRRWMSYAESNGHTVTVGRHSEPRMVGDVNGVRFLLAQSTELLGGGGGYYARTVITAAIEEGVPDGLRLYRRDALEWMHFLSGLRQVDTGDAALDEAFMIEGSDERVTREWVLGRASILRDLNDAFPRCIVYGSEIDGLPVAAGGASGAVTVLVVGRRSRPADLDDLIQRVTRYASDLGSTAVGEVTALG